MKIGIVGNGFVGQATARLCHREEYARIWDVDESKRQFCENLHDFKDCSFVFICVPTPMKKNGACDTSVVESVVRELMECDINKERIVIRSTVPVGTSRNLGVMFFPEFLTERNWKEDVKNCKTWVLGTDIRDDKIRDDFYFWLRRAYLQKCLKHDPELLFSSTGEAELAKYVRNCFLAVKVSFFNEIEKFCDKKDLNYEQVRGLTCLDERIGKSHTQVPGPDGKKGFGGTCFPKDINSLIYQMNNNQLIASVMGAAKYRNENLDRPEQDWKEDKGRAVV
ncbi:hypothetical protein CMI37_33740 [Candidatus Pacearchaeota archaeon]|nr:hypothetical protein [Candidatus Pacearchaeota archaeon]